MGEKIVSVSLQTLSIFVNLVVTKLIFKRIPQSIKAIFEAQKNIVNFLLESTYYLTIGTKYLQITQMQKRQNPCCVSHKSSARRALPRPANVVAMRLLNLRHAHAHRIAMRPNQLRSTRGPDYICTHQHFFFFFHSECLHRFANLKT